MKRYDPEDIAGVAELADRYGVERATLHAWRARHEDFPEPIRVLASASLFSIREVDRWLRLTGRREMIPTA